MFIKDDAKVPVDLRPLKEDPSKWSIDRQDAKKKHYVDHCYQAAGISGTG